MSETTDKSLFLKRTIFYDEDTETLCSCSGDFSKHCSLRLANDLPCQESFVHISPIKRDVEEDPSHDVLKALDEVKRKMDSIKKIKILPRR